MKFFYSFFQIQLVFLEKAGRCDPSPNERQIGMEVLDDETKILESV